MHGPVYGNIERLMYVNFDTPFLQKLQSGDPGTFMKLKHGPGAYLRVHFYIFELYTKFRVAWYQKREFWKFIEMVCFLIAGHKYYPSKHADCDMFAIELHTSGK